MIRRVLYWLANRHFAHPIVQAHFIGKRLLAGITDTDEKEKTLGQRQVHGTIVRLNRHECLVLRLPDGNEFKLPPDVRRIRKAKRGQYRLRSTGQVVVDPDFTACWVRIQHRR
jgi:hypothetical protein